MKLTKLSIEQRSQGLNYLSIESPIELESGAVLPSVQIAYTTYGDERNKEERTIYICHSLSADCHVTAYPDGSPGWWSRFVGPGRPLDLERYYVVCSNFLGGCFGTTGPSTISPRTGEPWNFEFPIVTLRDVALCKRLLLDSLRVPRLHSVIGGSFGGMQALQMLRDNSGFVDRAVILSANHRISAFALGVNKLARWALENTQGLRGLALARALVELSFLTQETLERRFGRRINQPAKLLTPETDYEMASYLKNKGSLFAESFDPYTFWYVMRMCDYFDLGDEAAISHSFGPRDGQVLHVSVANDAYFPEEECEVLRRGLERAGFLVQRHGVRSDIGHDAFFTDVENIGSVLAEFLQRR